MTDNDATQTRQDDADVSKELRRTLDEHGVKWRKWIYGNIDLGTVFSASGIEWIALWNPEINKLSITNYKTDLTPEQVIAVTLGESTCHFKTINRFIDNRKDRADICECDACGYQCARGFIADERFRYCPNCGARIEVDE